MHTARLQYDRIIITGASSGFGEAFAGTLAPHTAELVLIARNEAALRQLAAALEKRYSGLHASVLPCDLADEASLNMLISRLDSLPPGRTLLINNAGAGDYGDFSDGRWEKIRFLLRLNVESLTRLCHALVPSMKRNGGDIINLSSLEPSCPFRILPFMRPPRLMFPACRKRCGWNCANTAYACWPSARARFPRVSEKRRAAPALPET